MDFIFDGVSAFHSFGFLLMAAVFTLIGGGIVGYYLYWMFKARTIKGHISGLMVSGRKGKPVSEQDWKETKESEKTFTQEISDGMSKEPVATSFGLLFVLMFIGLPLIFVGIGGYMGYKYFDLTANGQYAEAKVLRNDSSYDSENGTSYKAVLEFHDERGMRYEVKDTISYGSSPSFAKGKILGVYYDPDDPEDFVIDDFWHNMAIAIAFSGFGLVFIGIIFLAGKFGNNKNQRRGKSGKSKKQSFNGETYYPVYSFRAPNGEIIEQVSTAGSNGMFGKLPGEKVTLKMMPNPPYTAKKFSFGFLLFGVVFLAPGLYIGSLAVKDFEFNVFTLLIPLGFIGFIAFKISKVISEIPPEERAKGMKFLKAQMSGKGAPEDYDFEMTSSDNSGPKRLLDSNEIKTRLKSQAGTQRITGYVTLLIAIGACVGAYFAGESMQKYMTEGVNISGEVVNIESRYDSSSDGGGYTYYAVVKFTDHNSRSVRFQDSVGSSTPMHKRGDVVDVIYLPDNPQKAIIDRGLMNWALSGGLLALAILMLYSAFYSFRWANKYGGSATKYKKRV